MEPILDEATKWKVKYEKAHHADWAKTLDGRIKTGGMWKTAKQQAFYFRLASNQPGSAKDAVTRSLHKGARKSLRGVKASHRLLITRYTVSPGGGKVYGKANVYEFDKDGLIRKWRVSRKSSGAGSKTQSVPQWSWQNAEVVWKRTGWRDQKKDHKVLPKSNVGQKQALSVARRIAGKYKVAQMADAKLRAAIMRGLADLSPIVLDYKHALEYKLGKRPSAPKNMDSWNQVIATDIERVISSFPEVAKKREKGDTKNVEPGPKDADYDAMYQAHLQSIGADEPGVQAGLKAVAGYNPYESKNPKGDRLEAAIRCQDPKVAALGVVREEGERVFWVEERDGTVYHYSQTKNEFGAFKDHLKEAFGGNKAKRALVALKEQTKKVLDASKD